MQDREQFASRTYDIRFCRSVCRIFAATVAFFLLLPVLSTQAIGQKSESTLDRILILQTVEGVGTTIRQEYFDAELAATVARALQGRAKTGDYGQIRTPESLASKLTEDLFELTCDKHLAVTVARDKPTDTTDGKGSENSRELTGRRSNFGVQRIEILAGNVGYLNLTAFYRPQEASDAIAAAMRTLQHADALILDVRSHGGGSPDTVALVASYFFAERRLPLFEIVPRSGEKRVYETESSDLLERNDTRPMYVLTSARTFSAGEGIAFLLQERGRAEVVGEKTAGAANPGRPYRINDHFEVTVPNGKVRTAVRGTNWEGTGVAPDVKVAAEKALRTAHSRALTRLLRQIKAGSWRDELQRQLDLLKSGQ